MRNKVRFTIISATVFTVTSGMIMAVHAIAPYSTTRPQDSGIVGPPTTVDYVSTPANGWAKVYVAVPTNVVERGTVSAQGREWQHTYTQDHCPAQFTIIGNGATITERIWNSPFQPGNPFFIPNPVTPNAGTLETYLNQEVNELIVGKPRREIQNINTVTVNRVRYWQASIFERSTFIKSSKKIRNNIGLLFRDARTLDPRSAAISTNDNGTFSRINICSSAVRMECGNNQTEVLFGEQCDDGNSIEGDGCNGACIIESCGNGYWEEATGEQCDDGNNVSGDGCSNTCVPEYCGDTLLQTSIGETCDDGNLEDGDGCSTICLTETSPPTNICGNLIVESPETCDDGNLINGDGCDMMCQTE